jgi:hypothetical protein
VSQVISYQHYCFPEVEFGPPEEHAAGVRRAMELLSDGTFKLFKLYLYQRLA